MINFVLKFINIIANCVRSLWSNRFISKFARELLILKLLCFIHTPVTAQVKTQLCFTDSAYSYMTAKEELSLSFNSETNNSYISLIPDYHISFVMSSNAGRTANMVISNTFKDKKQRRIESMGRPVLKYRHWC